MAMRDRLSRAAANVISRPAFSSMDVAVATDILQMRILHTLFSSMTRDLLLVKGGIAMKVLTGSHRDTTDIDLAAAPKSNLTTLRSHMMQAINRALHCGLIENARVREQDVSFNCMSPKWHISGNLAGSETKVHLKIEVSRRDLLPEDAVARFEYQAPPRAGVGPFTVRTYSAKAMAASKVAALLDVKRNKTRDVYDLAVLISCEVEPPVAMLAALGKDKLESMLGDLCDKVFSMSYKSFEQDVLTCLPQDVSRDIRQTDWEDMQLTVVDHVQKWLRAAHKIAPDAVIPRDELRDHYEDLQSKVRPGI